MSGTIGGLPYPDPTDPVANGANAIKDLATAVATTYQQMVASSRPLGTLGNMGVYTPNRGVHQLSGYQIGNTDATGQISWTLPAGITGIFSAWATPFYQSAEMLDVQWVLRLEQSSLTSLRFMARSTTNGSAYASVRMGMVLNAIIQN